jgi:hypothetical protein
VIGLVRLQLRVVVYVSRDVVVVVGIGVVPVSWLWVTRSILGGPNYSIRLGITTQKKGV